MRVNCYAYMIAVHRLVSRLCQKVLTNQQKALVWHKDLSMLEDLSAQLWSGGEFLPHGLINQGNPEHQQILLTNCNENLNSADCLILIDNTDYQNHPWADKIQQWPKVCELFSTQQDEEVKKNRKEFYRNLCKNIPNVNLFYYNQVSDGSWTEV